MHDFIPVADSDFGTWLTAFTTFILATPAEVGLTAADALALQNMGTDFAAAYTANLAAQTAARTARQAKDDLRTKAEAAIRSLVRRIQAYPGTTDAQRQALGITVHDTVLSPASKAALAASRPWASVDTSQRLRHTIEFRDAATKDRRAKPAGMKGCEIWVRIGTAPSNPPADMQFLALDTATPYLAEYSLADAGKVAYYMLRWVNTKDEKGAWSETVEATIVG